MSERKVQPYDILVGRLFSLFLSINILNIVFSLIGIFSAISHFLPYILAILFIFYILMHQREFGKIWRIFIVMIVWIGGMYFISALINNNLSYELFSRMYWTLLYCIPLGCSFLFVNDIELVIDSTKSATIFCTLCAVLVFLIFIFNKNFLTSPDYSMGLGFALLYPTLFHIKECGRNRKYIIISLLDVSILTLYGSRSQLLCVAIFVFLLYYFRNSILTQKGFSFTFLCAFFAIIFIVLYKDILQALISFLDTIGVHSRSLSYFLERTTYTGRELVWVGAIKLIKLKCITGWGIGLNTTEVKGSLPHNIVLELLLHYGIIFGLILVIGMLLLIYKGVFSKNGKRSEASLILFVTGFIPLLLSSSYLIWPQFWILIFTCIAKTRNKQQKI